MTRCGHKIDLQVINNETSIVYKQVAEGTWKANYKLVPPGAHFRNATKCDIRTFKAHFLAILAGVDPTFPKQHVVNLLPQTDLTLNLVHQSTLDPHYTQTTKCAAENTVFQNTTP